MQAVSMSQATRAEFSPPRPAALSPIRGENGDFLREADHGIHSITLAYRDGDVIDVDRAFAGPTWDAQTGETVLYGSAYDGAHKWLRHGGTGLRLDLKRHPHGFLLAASGSASSLVSQDKSVDGLVRVDQLHAVEATVRDQMARMGVPIPPSAALAVHRADLATDLHFDPAFGLDVLRAFSALPVPRHEPEIRPTRGSATVIKAVSWHRCERTQMRVYDRGRARGTDAPGSLIRLERQYCPPCREQMAVDAFKEADHAAIYCAPLGDYASSGVVVVPSWAQADELLQLRAGSDAKALSLMGALVRLSSRGRDGFPDPDAARRRVRALRRTGVVLSERVTAPLPLGAVIDDYIAPWRRH
jgi:hypothetical protein